MPNDKIDPFKPSTPAIPGTAPHDAGSEPGSPQMYRHVPPRDHSSPPFVWVAVAAVGVFIVVAALLFWRHTSAPLASDASSETAQIAPAAQPVKPAEDLPTGPGPIATTSEIGKPWAGKRFLYRDPLTAEAVPAMIVRLPDNTYWAFSLREPFGSCDLEYVTDLEKLRAVYGYRAEHPMIANTCTHSVFDLLKYGTASNGGLVRGDVAKGEGVRPPMAIEVKIEGARLIAGRME
jgi:hypothetical protein